MVTLLTKDTKKRSADEVAEAIEEVGGTFNEFSGNNTFGLSLEVLPGDIDVRSTCSGRRCSHRRSRRRRS
jgi:zinc protease